jgi:hypothetical protein
LKSRTLTDPVLTVVRVPVHVSVMVHEVPRAVAELLRPRVRKLPFTLLNSARRRLRFAAPTLGEPPGGSFEQALSPAPVIETVVSGFFVLCPTVNRPRLK